MINLIIDICHQVLDLYSSPVEKSLPSPPAQDKFIVPKKIIPPQSIYQKLLLQKMAVKYSKYIVLNILLFSLSTVFHIL